MDELEECDNTRIAPALPRNVGEGPGNPRFEPADRHEGGDGHVRRRGKNASSANEPDQQYDGDRNEAVLQTVQEPSDRNARSVASRPVNDLLCREGGEELGPGAGRVYEGGR